MKSALPKVLQPHRRPADARARHRRGARAAARRHPRGLRPRRRPGARGLRRRSRICTGSSRREQLGTGHAVQQAMPACPTTRSVLVLYGDVPLIDAGDTLQRLLDARRRALAVLAAELDDPTGYGRIVRDAEGRVAAIVEQKDATTSSARIRLVNTGILAADAARAASAGSARCATTTRRASTTSPTCSRMAAAEFERRRDRRSSHDPDEVRRRQRRRGSCRSSSARSSAARVRALCVRRRALRRSGAHRHPRRRARRPRRRDRRRRDPRRRRRARRRRAHRPVLPRCRTSSLAAGTEVRAHCDLDGARSEGAVHHRPVRAPAPGHRARRRRAHRQFRRDQERDARRGQQGQPPDATSATPMIGSERQHRRRHDHLQLRRREQVDDHDRRRRVHRLQHVAGRAGARSARTRRSAPVR